MRKVSFNRLESILSALPTVLVILKPDVPKFTVQEVNDAFLNLTNIERRNLLSKPFLETLRDYFSGEQEKSLSDLFNLIQRAISNKEIMKTDIIEFELDKCGTSTTHLYLQFKCSPVVNSDGAVDSLILIAEDLTETVASAKNISDDDKLRTRKELHNLNENLAAQAASSRAQYESASQELDDFVYSVSHDLRAPLRRIDGFSQELLNEYAEKLDDTGAHYLKRIRQGAQDMGQLIDNLLKLSRISRRNVEKEEFDLGEVAKTVFDDLIGPESERVVEIEIDENLKTVADKGLIKAMLVNLISNALKFTSKKEEAKIQVGSTSNEGEKVFYISDNGVGFNSAYSHKLFKAFSRLHSHHEFSGTGIGLATVKRIMTLHGGTIWAESPEGEGATFYFQF
ncbi:ATP-binding protein [Rhodohalobacter sulfatireducens]|uniref:histidine kinase n=1 Tax=Rhodohalobacter sulfatireducens TaxID=2911366 RepID=A0ABS9KJ08_9BACT|nr:ATP-binding protein [Rhodohalobacter sulfatireducens]MCG2590844.1 ATP-binding protein [Rhodohalobacter sulfatireducens]